MWALRFARVTAAVTVVALVGTGAPASAAPADDLDAKRAQAAAIELAIAENGHRISVLDEDFNEARAASEAAAAGIATAEQRLADARDRRDRATERLRSRAAAIYIRSSSGAPLHLLDASSVREMAVRAHYTSVAAAEDQRLVDTIAAASADLTAERDHLDQVRRDARATQERLGAARAEIEAAQHAQEALLAQVEGDIAELVAEIEKQRRREEEAAVRAELERRRAAEAAQREAAATRAAAARAAARRASTTTLAPGRPTPPVSAPTPAPAPNPDAQRAVDTALAQLGKPYRYAASGPDMFDCSGLTMYVWAAAGVSLPHSSRMQYAALPKVAMDELAPGDLVFYGSPIHHVGIFIGDGQYVHAPQTGDVVKISSIYRRDFAGSARPG
jgi:cell wall-associated NlpC family hydrolase